MIKVIKLYDVHGKFIGKKVYLFNWCIFEVKPELDTTLK
jgi:hypothetical protein